MWGGAGHRSPGLFFNPGRSGLLPLVGGCVAGGVAVLLALLLVGWLRRRRRGEGAGPEGGPMREGWKVGGQEIQEGWDIGEEAAVGRGLGGGGHAPLRCCPLIGPPHPPRPIPRVLSGPTHVGRPEVLQKDR